MSPYVDLTLAGASIDTKREADPLLSRELLEPRVTDYTAGQDAALGLISPVFADLSGLPPLIVQVGSHEVLLDDAVRLAQQAAAADVEVTLEVTPRAPHVFQAYQPLLDEAAVALDRAGSSCPRGWTARTAIPESRCRRSPAAICPPTTDVVVVGGPPAQSSERCCPVRPLRASATESATGTTIQQR